MKKEWGMPSMEELDITATADGGAPSDNFDGPWQNIDGHWYRPGAGAGSPQ